MPVSNLSNRSLIRVSGAEAAHFLHNLVTADIEGLGHGELFPGALLTPQGKILFDFLASRDGAGFVLDCRSEIAADFAKRLKFYRLRAKVDIELQEQALVSVSWQDDSSVQLGLRDLRFGTERPIFRTYGAAAGGDEAEYVQLRIDNGVPEGGADYAFGEAFPHDVNLDQTGGVSFSKGCYVGQEVVSRMQHRGTARRRVLIASCESALASGAEIAAGERLIGALGSALENNALALVRIDKVKDALDAGAEITAGGAPIRLSLPPRATFSWPETAGAQE
jgi:tRNA-modifying protein YgfZ